MGNDNLKNEIESITNSARKIAELFDYDIGNISTLDELSRVCEQLYSYIHKWMMDQKVNYDALQQLIDAQLEELSATYEGLSALFEINKIIASIEEPWMIMKSVLKLLKNAVNFSAGVLFLNINNQIYREFYGSRDAEEILEIFIEKYKSGENTIFVDFDKEVGGYVAVPLRTELEEYGILIISGYGTNKIFTAGDKKITEAVAQQILTAVNRYIMLQREIEKRRLEEQIEIARNIQIGLFPKTFPENERFDIGAQNAQARQVGGDYYDVIENDDGSIVCCIADVSGKGLPAALIMSSFRSMFRMSGKISSDMKRLAAQFDKMIHEDFETGRFITSIIFKISPEGHMEYVNAGHDPLYILRGNRIIKLESTGTPFGILGEGFYDVEDFELEKDDIIVAYTDGVVEARNIKGEEFGFERLQEIILRNRYLKASDIVDKIMNAVFEFSAGMVQHDDTTVLVVKYE
ncbi:PP2C family protein-serine/threonine phosphatase [Fervidobacterium sp.]